MKETINNRKMLLKFLYIVSGVAQLLLVTGRFVWVDS